MIEYFGIIGSLLFAACSWPLAWNACKNKSAEGLEWSFLLLWFFGCLFSGVYAFVTQKYALLPNFVCAGVGVAVILYIKIRETSGSKGHD